MRGHLIAGKYRLKDEIGRGGQGVVVEATDETLKRQVAIKIIMSARASSRARIFREARAAAMLSSEHCVKVFDVSALDNGTPCIVMECLNGESLSARIRRGGALSVRDALDVTLHVCEALMEAHGRGLVHRDVKPSNIYLVDSPTGGMCAKLLDFGLVRDTLDDNEGITATQSGCPIGSPAYMSPEQIRCSKDADVRADIWSLGITLYESITGSLPFRGEGNAGLMVAVLTEPPNLLNVSLSEQFPGLQRILSGCLQKAPNERYQSVFELACDLRALRNSLGGEHSENSISYVRGPKALSCTSLQNTCDATLVSFRIRARGRCMVALVAAMLVGGVGLACTGLLGGHMSNPVAVADALTLGPLSAHDRRRLRELAETHMVRVSTAGSLPHPGALSPARAESGAGRAPNPLRTPTRIGRSSEPNPDHDQRDLVLRALETRR